MNRWRTAAAVATAVAAIGAVAAGGASAATATPPAPIAPPGMTVQTVNNGPGGQFSPAVSGSLVTYTDESNPGAQIRYHDFATGTDAAVPQSSGVDVLSDVFGTTVVYTHAIAGCEWVYTYDTSSGNPPAPVDSACPQREQASIGGGTIAWEDYTANATNGQIVVLDRSTGVETALTDTSVLSRYPDVSPDGSTVAWISCASDGTDCHVWDGTRTATGVWATRQLTSAAVAEPSPSGGRAGTNGSIVVYTCADGNVCWQPAAGGTETELAFTGVDTRISANLIVFLHPDALGNYNVFAYDLSTGTLYEVTNGIDTIGTTDVWVDPQTGQAHVVWSVNEETNGYNVYEATFTPVQPDPPLTITRFAGVADRRGNAAAGFTFTDADPNGNLSQYSGTIDWGDGSQSPLVLTRNPLGGFAAGGVHHYAHAGAYAATATIHDSGGATATRTTTIVVPSR